MYERRDARYYRRRDLEQFPHMRMWVHSARPGDIIQYLSYAIVRNVQTSTYAYDANGQQTAKFYTLRCFDLVEQEIVGLGYREGCSVVVVITPDSRFAHTVDWEKHRKGDPEPWKPFEVVAPQVIAPTFYDTLNLKPSATQAQIKKAYRRAAFRFHPDRNSLPAATEKFKRCTTAYETLGDVKKRQEYDATLAVKGRSE